MLLATARVSRRVGSVAGRSPRVSLSTSSLGGAIIIGANGQEIHLPPAESAVTPTYLKWLYCPNKQSIQTSTHVGTDATLSIARGKVGDGDGLVSPIVAQGYARMSGLRLLATLNAAVSGDLSRVLQVTKLVGIVNGSPEFTSHGFVVNGCSEVFIEAFGTERGVGVRTCTGAGSGAGCVTCDVEVRVRPPG